MTTKKDLEATVARADYKEGNPESEVRRLARRFERPFELAKQSPGDGAIYKLEHKGRTLIRAKGRKAFVAQLHAFEEGLQFAFFEIRRSYFAEKGGDE